MVTTCRDHCAFSVSFPASVRPVSVCFALYVRRFCLIGRSTVHHCGSLFMRCRYASSRVFSTLRPRYMPDALMWWRKPASPVFWSRTTLGAVRPRWERRIPRFDGDFLFCCTAMMINLCDNRLSLRFSVFLLFRHCVFSVCPLRVVGVVADSGVLFSEVLETAVRYSRACRNTASDGVCKYLV